MTKAEMAQYKMPQLFKEKHLPNSYNIYPSFELSKGEISVGYNELTTKIAAQKVVAIDGYIGVNWDQFINKLKKELEIQNIKPRFISTVGYLKKEEEINEMIKPYLGADDPVFGKLCHGSLIEFYNNTSIEEGLNENEITIIYGVGAALFKESNYLIYIDIPKNEIQYRSREGQVLNLGAINPLPPKPQYKRMYFIDWQVLNRHKHEIINNIDIYIDGQFEQDISWIEKSDLHAALQDLSRNAFRARPWFEPGVWGGQWIKNKIEGLNKNVVNYAWSFELITPENGIVLSKDGVRLEISFDMLMYFDSKAMLGKAHKKFKHEFPIRFDFLDTVKGENLSLQCHPTKAFMAENFGESFTQDETYYILDCEENAQVVLGFKQDIQKEKFEEELINCRDRNKKFNADKYVQYHAAKKHDLFLIPNGTIHCSGKNNMVLEISSTPYIYTFKMYDWGRMDLDGKPRPLNVDRAMANLNFDCKGDVVKKEYISNQIIINEQEGIQTWKLATHQEHFYEVYRHEFENEIIISTEGQCHILSLVEGEEIEIITGSRKLRIKYAETFVIPAVTGKYIMRNAGGTKAKVVQANVKNEYCVK